MDTREALNQDGVLPEDTGSEKQDSAPNIVKLARGLTASRAFWMLAGLLVELVAVAVGVAILVLSTSTQEFLGMDPASWMQVGETALIGSILFWLVSDRRSRVQGHVVWLVFSAGVLAYCTTLITTAFICSCWNMGEGNLASLTSGVLAGYIAYLAVTHEEREEGR